jgi:hypothetical protein
MHQPSRWSAAEDGVPLLGANESWTAAIQPLSSRLTAGIAAAESGRRRLVASIAGRREDSEPLRLPLVWMPATRYQPHWRQMRAFALPSFYDGRIRVNLAERERHGTVAPAEYAGVCDEIEELLGSCRDPRTGESVVAFIERNPRVEPRSLGPTESDMVVVWQGSPLAIEHPRLGAIGPIPYRRTGGHTGRFGVAYLAGQGMATGNRGIRSSFDVVPTIVELLGAPPIQGLSGSPMLD